MEVLTQMPVVKYDIMIIEFNRGDKYSLQKFEDLFLGKMFITFFNDIGILKDFVGELRIKIKEDDLELFLSTIEIELSITLERFYFF